MPDYQKAKIYQIWNTGFNKCYIGSTVEELSRRMARHRSKYKQYLLGKYPYTSSFGLFDEYGIYNCEIKLLENFPCKSKAELESREGLHIRNTVCINKYIAGRTSQQYYWDNKEKDNATSKLWREKNKEYKKEYDRKYREENNDWLNTKLKTQIQCECGCLVSKRNIASHRKTPKHKEFMDGT